MALLMQDFRRQIVRSAAERVSLLAAVEDFGEAEVGKADVAVLVHENVFGFQVTINNFLFVQVANSHAYLN